MTTANIGINAGLATLPYSPQSNMPAGTIISYSGSIASFTSTAMADSTTLIHKDGWAVCNGASVPKATYSQLFARIDTIWNASVNPLTGSNQAAPADATNNFRIPNLQGTFLRGVGDFTDNTKDTTLAVFQSSQNLSHSHTVVDTVTGKKVIIATAGSAGSSDYIRVATSSIVELNTGAGFGTYAELANQSSGATESRPQNVGVYYLIKLYDNVAAVDVYIPSASSGIAGLVDNTAGNTAGTPILGRTDGQDIPSGYIGEYKFAKCTSAVTASSSSNIDVTGMSIDLESGNWEIGYDVCATINNNSGSANSVYGRLCITDSSNNIIDKTVAFFGEDNMSSSVNSSYLSISRRTIIKITSTTTYKLRLAGTATGRTAGVVGDIITGVFTDPDNNSIIWARRI